MSAHIYLEGAAESKEAQIRCRESFRKLIEKMGHAGKMPRLTACGSREATFKDFKTALAKTASDYIAMLVDSEDPIEDLERTWSHLRKRDGWKRPEGAEDDQALLMTTCMETWLVADQKTLKAQYGKCLQESALPALVDLEERHRHDVQDSLSHATRSCPNAYKKGDRSFELLAKLEPSILKQRLPSFVRISRILDEKLQGFKEPTPGKARRSAPDPSR